MEKGNIYRVCKSCNGTGIETVGTYSESEMVYQDIECRTCAGEKIKAIAGLSDDLISMLEDMQNKINDIKEKVDEIKEGMP